MPRIEHYSCMSDLLGWARLQEEVEEFVENIPLEPDSVLWGTLFGACQIHKQVEVGEKVMGYLLEMDPGNKSELCDLIKHICCHW